MALPTSEVRPSVSVALGTHNGERFLAEQLRSILAQSYPVAEIVLSDDHSRDNTIEVARLAMSDYLSQYPPAPGETAPVLRVLTNVPALGVTQNFESAIAACGGDYISLCDQDDVWHPERIATLVALCTADEGCDLVFSDARMVDGVGTPLGYSLFAAIGLSPAERALIREGNAFEVLLRRNVVTGATALFRRSLVERATPFPPEWVHDEWLAVVAAATARIAFSERELIDYRQHGSNQIGALQQSLWGKIRKLFLPRERRNQRLHDRARTLAPRLDVLAGVSAERRARAHEKLDHESFRLALPASRLRRIRPILRELRTGRYSDFDYGRKDAVRDLLQPAR
ncbi:glycosyltransferase family 2 protein [Klugiella xanthotipulae]|uniref:Glycosyltransferase involved in cell wall biosynthesis n=1 Tax=Klugiella xanthotipulae TaxID=244735 RepID=A0A543HYN1_9MICO|nr:glycosyltransferase family 2 protein [Klugiella xanthotipulae]TQM63390.1 glycosyltransferase involved in cell wall biosynthesis [Klugiella xanthotipulae]